MHTATAARTRSAPGLGGSTRRRSQTVRRAPRASPHVRRPLRRFSVALGSADGAVGRIASASSASLLSRAVRIASCRSNSSQRCTAYSRLSRRLSGGDDGRGSGRCARMRRVARRRAAVLRLLHRGPVAALSASRTLSPAASSALPVLAPNLAASRDATASACACSRSVANDSMSAQAIRPASIPPRRRAPSLRSGDLVLVARRGAASERKAAVLGFVRDASVQDAETPPSETPPSETPPSETPPSETPPAPRRSSSARASGDADAPPTSHGSRRVAIRPPRSVAAFAPPSPLVCAPPGGLTLPFVAAQRAPQHVRLRGGIEVRIARSAASAACCASAARWSAPSIRFRRRSLSASSASARRASFLAAARASASLARSAANALSCSCFAVSRIALS